MSETKTATIIIGNTDNRLTQQQWAEFVERVEKAVHFVGARVEFFGGCNNWARYQNTAWVVVVPYESVKTLRGALKLCAEEFRQDSIAFVVGLTEFLKA